MGWKGKLTAFVNPVTMVSAGAKLIPTGIPVVSQVAGVVSKGADLSTRTALNVAKEQAGKYVGGQISQQVSQLSPEVQSIVNPLVERYSTPFEGDTSTLPIQNSKPDNLVVKSSPDDFSRLNSFAKINSTKPQDETNKMLIPVIAGVIALLFLTKK